MGLQQSPVRESVYRRQNHLAKHHTAQARAEQETCGRSKSRHFKSQHNQNPSNVNHGEPESIFLWHVQHYQPQKRHVQHDRVRAASLKTNGTVTHRAGDLNFNVLHKT